MISDELGVKLHDQATRGLPLSVEEQAQLQAWYDEKDREEAAMLRLTPAHLNEAESVMQMPAIGRSCRHTTGLTPYAYICCTTCSGATARQFCL